MSKNNEIKAKNKLKCKLYYTKNKNELKTLKELNTELKDEIHNLKLKLSVYTDIYDDNDDNDDDDDDIEPDENKNYYELYDELALKTKNFNLVFIKDYELNLNNNLLKYQNLFLDNLDEKALDNKRIEWLLNMKKYLNGSNNEYEAVYYPYQLL